MKEEIILIHQIFLTAAAKNEMSQTKVKKTPNKLDDLLKNLEDLKKIDPEYLIIMVEKNSGDPKYPIYVSAFHFNYNFLHWLLSIPRTEWNDVDDYVKKILSRELNNSWKINFHMTLNGYMLLKLKWLSSISDIESMFVTR